MEPLFTDFGTSTTLSTTLNETLTSSDTTITLTDASDFPLKGSITIGDETITYTGKSSNDLTGCVRGSSATSHSSGATVTTVARSSQSALSSDKQKAGWYLDRLHNDKTLRLSDSDITLSGSVRFNRNNSTFQGFNGTSWVDFNATQGEQGEAGTNGISTFDMINLPDGETNAGEVYASTDGTDVNFRTLKTTTFDINPAMTDIDALSITKSDNYLTLTPASRPYSWDFSSNNSITYLKSSSGDATFKAFGQTSTWKVKSSSSVTAGTIVRITLSVSGTGYTESTTELVIEPYTYSALQEEINEGSAVLGVALQTKSGGNSCLVCTEGITTVLIGDGDGAGNQTSSTIDGPGAFGFVGYDGRVYNESLSTGVSSNTPSIGYWLERGTFSSGSLVLFHVKTGFSMT